MPDRTHVFQAPKGTRDFYPAEMSVRRWLENIWRTASIRHGFEEIEGPNFEHLELYTLKSGPGIVSELFSFRRAGGETDYALRPEFTPTLARMYAARAGSLPPPTRWFSIPVHYRAERPQRGRLREFVQWNVDVIGDATPRADAEVIAAGVDVMQSLGLTAGDIQVKLSHRGAVVGMLVELGLDESQQTAALELLDRRDRMEESEFLAAAAALKLDRDALTVFDMVTKNCCPASDLTNLRELGIPAERLAIFEQIQEELRQRDLLEWCSFDFGVVRGLAYYTGTVFEFHEASGRERAVAGGGRYDELIELVGGPAAPAVGFAMGDVVISLILQEKGLLKQAEEHVPRPDVFVISSGDEAAERKVIPLVAQLRRAGLHARHSSRATRNVGKLLGEASRARAMIAVILGRELEQGNVVIKDLTSGEQSEAALENIVESLRALLAAAESKSEESLAHADE